MASSFCFYGIKCLSTRHVSGTSLCTLSFHLMRLPTLKRFVTKANSLNSFVFSFASMHSMGRVVFKQEYSSNFRDVTRRCPSILVSTIPRMSHRSTRDKNERTSDSAPCGNILILSYGGDRLKFTERAVTWAFWKKSVPWRRRKLSTMCFKLSFWENSETNPHRA